MKSFFWKKFSRFLLIGLSAMVLLAGGKQMVLGDVLQRGPNAILAAEDNCLDPANDGCPEPGGGFQEPEPLPPPPGQPPPPSGGPPPISQCTPVFQYNECIGCNTSRPVYTDSCSGAFTTGPNQPDGACSYLCGAPPPPPPDIPPPIIPPPSCPANQVISTTQRCVGTQMCTFNIHYRQDCSTYEGGAYACRDDPACGFTPQQPTCTPGPCNGPAPACGQTGTGWDGCKICPIQGPACQPPPSQQPQPRPNTCPGTCAPSNGPNPTNGSCTTSAGQAGWWDWDDRPANSSCTDSANAYCFTCQAAVTPPPPTTTCSQISQGGQCISCNTTRETFRNSCSGAITTQDRSDTSCSYLCGPSIQQGFPSCVLSPQNSTISSGQSVNFFVNASSPNGSIIRYEWNNGSGFFSSGGQSNSFTFFGNSTVTVRVTNQANMTAECSAFVNVQTQQPPGCQPTGICSPISIIQCGPINPGRDNCGNPCNIPGPSCPVPPPITPPPPPAPIIVTITSPQTATAGGSTSSATGGSSSSSSTSTVTVSTPQGAATAATAATGPRVVFATADSAGVGTTGVAGITVLPKTGIPALVWTVLAFVPAGFRLRRFNQLKEDFENNPQYIWDKRKYSSQ